MKKLLGLTLEELRQVAAEVGLRSFAAGQMAAWLYQKRVDSIEAMTDLPKEARRNCRRNTPWGAKPPKLRP